MSHNTPLAQHSLGRHIRQLRRERGLTQAELGGDLYSKSYVSAMERGSIVPSQRALRFFSTQLQQTLDSLEELLPPPEPSHTSVPALYNGDDHSEMITVLDLVLAGKDTRDFLLTHALPQFPGEMLMTLPPAAQAGYTFLKGLAAQEKGDLTEARLAFESALALAPIPYRPAILDALGINAFLLHMYQSALHYHHRAYHLLLEQQEQSKDTCLLLQVESHCGDDYRALGMYAQALTHYENACNQLHPSHNMNIAAHIYLGLGYCTYASITSSSASEIASSLEERSSQRAINYLIQSRTLYQTGQDLIGASEASLLQAVALLDYSIFKLRDAQEKGQKGTGLSQFASTSMLDDAAFLCRQALLQWQEVYPDASSLPAAVQPLLHFAASSLARTHLQHASIARLLGYNDTSIRERSVTATICQNVLDGSAQQTFSWQWVQESVSCSIGNRAPLSRIPSLPHLPNVIASQADPMRLAEIYQTAGEVAEEIGRAATSLDYAQECYTRADQCFQAALQAARRAFAQEGYDPGMLARRYQRYAHTLEDRLKALPEMAEEIARTTLQLLKEKHSYIFC